MNVHWESIMARPSYQQPHVLVVDDDEEYLLLVERTLVNDGYRVTCIISGEEIIEAAQRYQPDLILLDIRMEGLNGFEVCQHLKANGLTADIPVIFHTAEPRTEGNLARAFGAGSCDFISKPLSRVELLFRIRNAIQHHQHHLLLQQLQTHDPLTGLPNRTYLRARIEEEIIDTTQHGCDLSLVMAEIDGFDRLISEYGRGAGDSIRRKFSVLLQSQACHHDTVGCWSLNRFTFVLPRVGYQAAASAADRLSKVWRNTQVPYAQMNLAATASFGVVCQNCREEPISAGQLVRQAETVLEYSRERGGNAVAVQCRNDVLRLFPEPCTNDQSECAHQRALWAPDSCSMNTPA